MGVHRLRDLRVIYLVALGLSLPPRQLLLQGRRRLRRRPLRVRRGRLRGVLSKYRRGAIFRGHTGRAIEW